MKAGRSRAAAASRPGKANGRLVHRHRTVDTLSRMLEAGTISPEMCEAGRSFQTDFALAALDPIRARPLALPCGGGPVAELTDRQLDARGRVHKAFEAVGGIGSPGGSCLWHVLGCSCSVREWARRRAWSGSPVRQELAAGILVAVLGVLARTAGATRSERPNK
jgi:hypothetical protein